MISKKTLIKFFAVVLAGYLLLAGVFYLLGGRQIRYRNSRGELAMPEEISGWIELVDGVTVEQTFHAPIQIFQSVCVKFAAGERTDNSGTVTVRLIRNEDQTVILEQSVEAKDISEGEVLTFSLADAREDLNDQPLTLSVSADSDREHCVSLCVSGKAEGSDFALTVSGEEGEGRDTSGEVILFAAHGEDHIWIGLHYWKLVVIGFGLLLIYAIVAMIRHRHGKNVISTKMLFALKKYRFLIRQLVARDFKTKYKRSVLGVLWSFLNPLLMMIVQYVVFSTIFRSDIKLYPAYLLIGIISFNFFSEACGMCLTSITGNAALITKVYVPKYIYPLTRLMSSTINLGISLIPLSLVSAFTGVHFSKATVLAFYFWICLIIFSFGLGLLLSSSMVFFRDTQFLWNVLCMIWMYGTPVFYPETIIPERFRFILTYNPLFHFFKGVRICILDGISPEPMMYIRCFAFAVGMLLIGSIVFRKSQDRFLLYI